ncbi:CNNM protein [Trypanosoma melophagium]|uniref:CNNM protein n=1 Tax=Trypanosoma melophagium TaxID=715481 RepID=UPI00351A17B8|nr:CNNM protein [Trypanosoma melophagium]
MVDKQLVSHFPIQCFFLASVMMFLVGEATTSEVVANRTTRKESNLNGYAAWPLPLLLVIFFISTALAAMFSGLTIGLFGMDFIMLDIISTAGKEPDKSYARKIIPIRRYGHQLLATLLIGNMLTMVVISQMVAAMIKSTEFVNFIVATVIVFIFAEIIPMGICNKGPYALCIGAKSAPVVSVALFLLFPVAKPLGMLLECIVTHDEGLVYDRNELKKLIRIHCEKYSHMSGLEHDEMRMMIGALEMNEANLESILTPLDKVLMLSKDLHITRKVVEQLWIFGKSRVPVYANECRSHVVGLLYVRDLIKVTSQEMEEGITVEKILNENPHDIVIVPEKSPLSEVLKVFQSTTYQLMFVERVNSAEASLDINESTSLASRGKTRNSAVRSTVLTQNVALESHVEHQIIGIVTLEDVIERIIKADIYDEYDEYSTTEPMDEGHNKGENEEEKRNTGSSEFKNITLYGLENVPRVLPRVNFYSYTVEEKSTTTNNEAMTESQKWALANFLINSYVVFATWDLPKMKQFIDFIGEYIIRIEKEEKGPVLYTKGERSHAFTLLLSGGIRVLVADGAFSTEKRSFSSFGEKALLYEEGFVPDYTAFISRTSRYMRFTFEELAEFEDNNGKSVNSCSNRSVRTPTESSHKINMEESHRMHCEEIPLPQKYLTAKK